MSKLNSFPSFYYYPIELQKESQHIQIKYKDADQVPGNLTRIKLPKLLQQIRNLSEDTNDIIEFAKKLNKIEINILASEYPYEVEDNSTIRKIILILMERYNRIVGNRFWQHFQVQPFDKQITSLLKHAFQVENKDYLALKTTIRENYNSIFSLDNIVHQMGIYIGREKKVFLESFSEWRIVKDSKLSEELWFRMVERFITEQWFIDAQGVRLIEDTLENMSIGKYKGIINNYLNAFEFQSFHQELLEQVIQRLNDPRENLSRWEGISENAIAKVEKWLFKAELFEFLDYERFDYWEKYIRLVTDLKVIEDPPMAAMYFNDFVVLEFGHTGNAAYFYETKGFSKYLASKLTSNVLVSKLKDRNADFYINKLNHAGNWDSRFDKYMENYLKGSTWYRH